MENQHRKIKGYRELSQEEIDLMNEIKAKAEELEILVQKVDAKVKHQGTEALRQGGEEAERINAAQPMRWASIARTDLQTGIMALVRAVAQPETF